LLVLVRWRPAGAVAAEQFWMVHCLLTVQQPVGLLPVQQPVGVAPAVTLLPLLALLGGVLLMRSCYLLVQMTALLMVAMLMLVWYAVLRLALQWPKQSDAMRRVPSPAVPVAAAGGAQP
jgi:hypothetical protein